MMKSDSVLLNLGYFGIYLAFIILGISIGCNIFFRIVLLDSHPKEILHFKDEIHLITQWFVDPHSEERNREYMTATCFNFLNENIKKIHFIESLPLREPFQQLKKVCDISLHKFNRKARFYLNSVVEKNKRSKRLTAGAALQFANRYLKGFTVILSNFDIYFDNSLAYLSNNRWLSPGRMYFLSRYEKDDSVSIGTQCGPKYIGSHDSFVFIPPISKVLIESSLDLSLGVPGIENRLIYDFRKFGVQILNPCKTIRSWHEHASGFKADKSFSVLNPDGLSGIVRPAKLIRNPTADDLSQ